MTDPVCDIEHLYSETEPIFIKFKFNGCEMQTVRMKLNGPGCENIAPCPEILKHQGRFPRLDVT